MSKSLYTYRSRKHDKRPNFIVGANRTHFYSMRITSKEKSGHHNNIRLSKNPDPKRKNESAYMKKNDNK